MSDAGDFVDGALQREGSWHRAQDAENRLGTDLHFYGASVGAVRGTIRDAGRRYTNLNHDDITALSSELWEVPVFERRLAAVVLLQSNVQLLKNTDLTRIEGFIRDSHLRELVDPLAMDVIGPMIAGFDTLGRVRADSVLDRWARDPLMTGCAGQPSCPRFRSLGRAEETGQRSIAVPGWRLPLPLESPTAGRWSARPSPSYCGR